LKDPRITRPIGPHKINLAPLGHRILINCETFCCANCTPGTNTFTLTPVSAGFSSSDTKIGWTVGGGFEGVLGGNWIGKIEYLYVDLGTVSGTFSTPVVTTTGALLVSRFSSHITDNILRIGLNYKIGAPAAP
jgi:opacity protein-like surface antigen